MYNKGGQRRTIEAGCGYKCVGHPTEVNKKWIRHKRTCSVCKEGNSLKELPTHNKEGGLTNGWNGFTGKKQSNRVLTTAYIDGKRNDIYLDGVKGIENAMNIVKATLIKESSNETDSSDENDEHTEETYV